MQCNLQVALVHGSSFPISTTMDLFYGEYIVRDVYQPCKSVLETVPSEGRSVMEILYKTLLTEHAASIQEGSGMD